MFKKTGPQIGVQCNAKPLDTVPSRFTVLWGGGGGANKFENFSATHLKPYAVGINPTLTSENKDWGNFSPTLSRGSRTPASIGLNAEIICSLCTDKKENQISLIYKEIQKGSVVIYD